MNRKQVRFIDYCLTIGLIAVLTMVTASCSTTPTSIPTHTPPLPYIPTPTLSSIMIEPTSPPNLAVGSTGQFVAIGTNSNGSAVDITSTAIWSSSNINVATVSLAGSGGLVTGVAAGIAILRLPYTELPAHL